MAVGLLTLRLLIREARSLKDKRRVVHAFRDRVAARCNVSIAETALHDNKKLAEFGIAAVGADGANVEHALRGVREMAEIIPGVAIVEGTIVMLA